jgi:hypothetical protein
MAKSNFMLRFATVVSIYLTSGQITVHSSSQPSSAPTFGVITPESIQNEGLACFAMAKAIPGLKTLTGKFNSSQYFISDCITASLLYCTFHDHHFIMADSVDIRLSSMMLDGENYQLM